MPARSLEGRGGGRGTLSASPGMVGSAPGDARSGRMRPSRHRETEGEGGGGEAGRDLTSGEEGSPAAPA